MASDKSYTLCETLKKAEEAELKIEEYKQQFTEKYGICQINFMKQLTELRSSLIEDEKQLELNDEQIHRNNEIVKQSYNELHTLKQQLVIEYNSDEKYGNYYLDGEDFRLMIKKYFQEIKMECLMIKNRFTREEYFDRIIAPHYKLSTEQLRSIRNTFLRDLHYSLNKNINKQMRSSIKQIKSLNIENKIHFYKHNMGNSTIHGIHYVINWNINNIHVIRCEFNQHPTLYKQSTYTIIIKDKWKEDLYENIALIIKKYMIEHFRYDIEKTNVYHIDSDNNIIKIPMEYNYNDNDYRLPLGITISEKENNNNNNNNIINSLQDSFDKYNIPLIINGICNDESIGILFNTAFEKQTNYTRIGLILNTPIKASYIEPKKNNEIITIEIGSYNKLLPRQLNTDILMDSYTNDKGKNYLNKMISVKYLGELVRLLCLNVFGSKILKYKNETLLTKRWGLKWQIVAKILQEFDQQNMHEIYRILRSDLGLKDFTHNDGKLFVQICRVIVNRSADLSSSLLLAILEKTNLFKKIKNKQLYILNEKLFNNKKKCYIGINGHVWSKMSRYQQRMKNTMQKIVNKKIVDKIKLINSYDGNGKGCALAIIAKTQFKQHQQQQQQYKKYD